MASKEMFVPIIEKNSPIDRALKAVFSCKIHNDIAPIFTVPNKGKTMDAFHAERADSEIYRMP